MEIERLAPRERELAQIVVALGEASATDIERKLSDPLSNSAVRSMLRRLERKGVVRRHRRGNKFVYVSATPTPAARVEALRRISQEYFGGSLAAAAAAIAELARTERATASSLGVRRTG
ncbi:BlaI/MecI/CopY family transcriptional regulator [Sphingosinicella terrae]|uniref:BlaI/MecI/CopY family transcriptional regulator n=1 Tax=Sphingosinicella terrae TaxID=2172047 RepID=UPI0013B38EED|nr:BlaI/MecI/CopY family transcriptional regulator [Sphingosinicella terrae]